MKNALKNDLKVVQLGEVLDSLENGSRPKGGVGDLSKGIPSIGGEHINSLGGFSFEKIKYISEDFFNSFRRGKIKENDILVVKDGATTGKVAFVDKRFPFDKAAVNEHVFVLRVKTNLVIPKYLFYHLFSPIGQSQIDENFHGAAIGGINSQFVNNYKLPLPLLPIQKKIVSILENAEKAKEMRKTADELTKDFLKSIFIEMFGDPVSNSKTFPIVKLKDLALIERNSVTADNVQEGDKYVGLEHLESESGRIIKIISVSDGELKSNKFSFDENCILYGKLRPYLNKIALPHFKGICSTDIVPIRPIKDKSNKYFISYILKQPYYIQLATDRSVGANLPRLSPRELEIFEIINPPLPLQQEFAARVKEVEQLKEQQKKSKEQIDNLFNVLIQKAFKGELI